MATKETQKNTTTKELSNDFAVIKTGGKQYLVQEGQYLNIEKLDLKEGDKVTFDQVLALSSDSDFKIGAPTISGAKVSGEVLKHGRAKKVIVMKYKAKSNYSKKNGHRQPFTQVKIISIK